MLEVKIQDHEQHIKDEVLIHADTKCWMLNAAAGPYLKKGERFPYKTEEFLPKDMRPKNPVVTEAEKSKRWAAAGAAMMKVVREHERETGERV